MAENIINKNLSGFTKEMLDMTYPDEYYKNTIQPAKAGTGPVPSKMQMFSKFQPGKAMMIGMDPYLPGFMQQGYDKFRAAPTQAVKNIAGTLGKGITSLASLPAQAAMFTLGSTPANADEANMTAEDFRALAEANSMTYGSSPITSSPFVDAGRDFSMFDQARMGDAVSGTNVQGMDLEMDPGAFMNPNIQPSQNMFQRAGNFVKDLELEEYLPFIGERSLTGMLGRGIGNLFQNIAPARYGYSTDRFNRMTPGQQSYTSNLYGPGGLLQGYNQKSAFGLGALGTLGNRLTAIQNRKAPQTAASLARQEEIKNAINQTINTGEREALADPNRSVQHPGSNIRTRTDIDVADGGAETSGGKIVCTMMNESYGFGNFRNKIWLRQSKDLAPEYQKGYHILFLPLVKIAKTNKTIKKVLEHIAVHRTIDIRQESRGKTHMLGRIYRKILEPICFIVGKVSNNV